MARSIRSGNRSSDPPIVIQINPPPLAVKPPSWEKWAAVVAVGALVITALVVILADPIRAQALGIFVRTVIAGP